MAASPSGTGGERDAEPASADEGVIRDNIARLGGGPEVDETGADEFTAPMEPQLEPPDGAEPVLVDEAPIVNVVQGPRTPPRRRAPARREL